MVGRETSPTRLPLAELGTSQRDLLPDHNHIGGAAEHGCATDAEAQSPGAGSVHLALLPELGREQSGEGPTHPLGGCTRSVWLGLRRYVRLPAQSGEGAAEDRAGPTR